MNKDKVGLCVAAVGVIFSSMAMVMNATMENHVMTVIMVILFALNGRNFLFYLNRLCK